MRLCNLRALQALAIETGKAMEFPRDPQAESNVAAAASSRSPRSDGQTFLARVEPEQSSSWSNFAWGCVRCSGVQAGDRVSGAVWCQQDAVSIPLRSGADLFWEFFSFFFFFIFFFVFRPGQQNVVFYSIFSRN